MTVLSRDRGALIWDAHACMPIVPNHDLSQLQLYRNIGATFISINVGMDFNPLAQVVRVIAGYRDWLLRHPADYVLVQSFGDVQRAHREGKLAVAFDLEGSVMLEDDLAMLRLFRDLGVLQMHLAYNLDNSIAGGCHGEDRGLTQLGKSVVQEMNRVGIIVDCSHASKRTCLDITKITTKPVVFSHSNVRAIWEHPRNIDDDQIKACAATGGVVGLSGIGIFIGENDIRIESLVRHVDHVADLVGVKHIGFGLDYSFGKLTGDLPPGQSAETWWPGASNGYDFSTMRYMGPECFPILAEALSQRGYTDGDISAMLGENFSRVAEECWI